MEDRSLQLRIQNKIHAAEAAIMREEARKLSGDARHRMNCLRTGARRRMTRLNVLAYGILRGIPYHEMERISHEKPPLAHAVAIAKNYGASTRLLAAWGKAAEMYLKSGDADEAGRAFAFLSPRYPPLQK